MKSFEKCLNDFLYGVELTKNIDYLDAKSIRKNNQGVNLYRKSAKYIAKYHSTRTDEFINLLNCNDADVQVCCAVCLVEFMNETIMDKGLIKNIIFKNLANADQAEKMGWEIWLSKFDL